MTSPSIPHCASCCYLPLRRREEGQGRDMLHVPVCGQCQTRVAALRVQVPSLLRTPSDSHMCGHLHLSSCTRMCSSDCGDSRPVFIDQKDDYFHRSSHLLSSRHFFLPHPLPIFVAGYFDERARRHVCPNRLSSLTLTLSPLLLSTV